MPLKLTPVTSLLVALFAAPAVARAEPPVMTQWGAVSEPRYPAKVCATLPAGIASRAGSIDVYDADGRATHPDTARIQAAFDACKDGAVKLVKGPHGEDGLLTGPLTLRSGVTLWIDAGVTLFASRDPKDYDNGPGDCGTANREGHKSCRSLLEGSNLVHAGIVGDGKIDARGGSVLLSGPNKGVKTWWDVAWLSMHGLTQHVFRILATTGGSDFTLYRTTFENSPNFHLVPGGMTGVTAWGIKILTPSLVYSRPGYACPEGTTPDAVPADRPATCFTPERVKNTDGFDPANSSNVLLAYSWISDGDDDVAIKAGGHVLSRRQMYAHNHFYYGHGMSLGSETDGGAEDIQVVDLVTDGHDSPEGNGIRIKSDSSRGGLVRNFSVRDVCLRNVAFPLVFDTHYSDKTGSLFPDFQGISVKDFHDVGGGKYGAGVLVFRGFAEQGQTRPQTITLDTIQFDGPAPSISSRHGGEADGLALATHFTVLPGAAGFAKLLKPSAERDVTVVMAQGGPSPPLRDCAGAFTPLKSVLADSPI